MSANGISELLDAKEALLTNAEAAGPDDLPQVIAQAERMYEQAIKFGFNPFALDALEIALRLPDVSRESWESLTARYDRLRHEIEERSLDLRLRLALADFHQGMEGSRRARPESERLLSAALPVLREFPGEAAKTAICEDALRAILLRTAALPPRT
jgi:hypothetical protein